MTQIPLAALFANLTPDLDVLAGLFAFAVLAMVAIAWLTAAPAQRRPRLPSRRAAGARAMV